MLLAVSCGAAATEWWVTPPSTHVFLNSSAPPRRLSSTGAWSMALQRGEAEAFMVHARVAGVAGAAPLDLGPPALCDSSGSAHHGAPQAAGASPPPPPLLFEWFKVAHVWCNRSSIYPAVSSRAGWYPDALLDGAYFSGGRIALEPGATHSFFIRLRAPLAAAPGTRSVGVCFGGAAGHHPQGLTGRGRGAPAPLYSRGVG